MKSQVTRLIKMGVIPCDKELSNEMFKEYDELLLFDEALTMTEAEQLVTLFSKDCDDLNWSLLSAIESAYSDEDADRYKALIERCNNEEFKEILKIRLKNYNKGDISYE